MDGSHQVPPYCTDPMVTCVLMSGLNHVLQMESISLSTIMDGSPGAPCISEMELLNLSNQSAHFQASIANSSQAGPSTQVRADCSPTQQGCGLGAEPSLGLSDHE